MLVLSSQEAPSTGGETAQTGDIIAASTHASGPLGCDTDGTASKSSLCARGPLLVVWRS